MKRMSIVGLGKLGLPMAAAMASRGYTVVGYDSDPAKIERIRSNVFPCEPGLDELIRQYSKRLTFTSDLSAVRDTSCTFVVVPTPSLKNGDFSIRHLHSALKSVGAALRGKKGPHVVAVVSTVLPGSMEKLRRTLEKSSGKKCPGQIGLCYNPAFIALGNVIHNFLHPDFVLIGESDRQSGETLERFYMHFCRTKAAIHRMNYINAELAKIAVNTFITMKISFGNMIARICEQLPDAHSETVTRAVGADRRIGTHYLKGALGYGGPCFPRDNKAFSFVARRLGLRAYSAEATDRINRNQIDWLASYVLEKVRPNDVIAILGLSYKPDTDVIDESQGVALAKVLLRKKRRLVLYDPAAMPEAAKLLEGQVTFARNLAEALRKAQLIVITTPWREFMDLDGRTLASSNGHPKMVLDCWRMLEKSRLGKKVEYVPLGVGLNTGVLS